MKNELITFETAKLAKEKGFNEECRAIVFIHEGKDYHEQYFAEDTYTNFFIAPGTSVDGKDAKHITAPTQSLLQKWLREYYRAHVQVVTYTSDFWTFNIYEPTDVVHIKYLNGRKIGETSDNNKTFKTYEEALEIGLLEALKLIK